MGKVALWGAAGAIGKSIADALRTSGDEYRVVGRDAERLKKAFGSDPKAEIVTWNPDDPASVRAAARGVETLIYLVGVPYDKFQLHPQVMQKTLDGAIAEGVKKVVLIGTVYPYGVPRTEKVTEEHPREPKTFKGKMRKEQEDILFAAHRAGKIQATELRLPDFYGPGVEASFLHRAFKAAVEGGTADMIGPINTPHEFCFVPDVGPVVLALMDKPEAYGRWWNFAGPEVSSQYMVADLAFAFTGKRVKFRVIGKTGLRVMGLFQQVMREMVEMHYLQTTPVLLDDSALEKLLGGLTKTRYAEGVRQSVLALGGKI